MRVARRGGSCLLGASSPGIQGPFWLELSSQQTDLGIVTHPSGQVAEVVGPRRSGPYPAVHDRRPAGVAPEGLGLPAPRPAEPASWKLPSLCSCSEAQHHGGASPHSRQTLRLWERSSSTGFTDGSSTCENGGRASFLRRCSGVRRGLWPLRSSEIF